MRISNDYGECVKALLICFCTELQNATHINGFNYFCSTLQSKFQQEDLQQAQDYIKGYLQSRRQNRCAQENIESALLEICNYHMGPTFEKGRMTLLPTNRFQLMNRLSQIYLVDSISRAIDYRLQFYKFHQRDLFGTSNDESSGNMDENNCAEQKTFLSQSMHGSRRHLRSLARNALALVSEYGRPTLFITLTCNPKWPEIVEQLLPGQTAFDRGDVVCQVFFRKVEALLKKLRAGKYFKEISKKEHSYKIEFDVQVVEYQRRGLPHVHLVLRFQDDEFMPKYEDKAALSK